VECDACGAVVTGGRFCSECGSLLRQVCLSCGAAVTGGRFCSECGAALGSGGGTPPSAAVSPPVVVQPVAERRVCSVLFCDLVGFTTLAESRDPEEVRELLSRYFDTARTVIERYGGIVEKFIGDAVMAVWGTPVALEGDAERAVRAALDLVDAVDALGNHLGLPGLTARAGVVTGEVAVTIGATNEGMVAGDAVNTAARVQSVAVAKSVYVDGATRRLAQAAVGFDDAGTHELKGKAEPQQLWRAVRVLSGVGGAQRVDGLEAPLIGREVELRQVKDLFHATVDRHQPRLLVVSGAAGVGKTRVGWEFEKYIDGLVRSVLWHRGRCLSYGDGVSFWALAEMVRQRFGIADDDQASVAAGQLSRGLADLLTDPGERAYVGIRLGRLLGVPVEGDSGQEIVGEELFAGWRLYLERLATINPVVMVIEDGQHADSGLLDFVDHLLEWSHDVPIFVVLVTRPELDEHRPAFGVGRNRTTLTLDPLDEGSMDDLLGELVPGMPSEARRLIATHAQGVPLFAVETIRSLIDRDVVVPHEGRYQLVGELGKLAVPDSLHALLAARLDALLPDVRALVADAAVVGTTFPAEALIAVSGRPDGEVRAVLQDLVRREVFEISADPLSPQRGTYRFAQQMLRQVAYDTLSRHDRKARHLAVAGHLRSTFAGDGEEVIDVIARHYLDAVDAVSNDTDSAEIRHAAAVALTRAGDRARRTGAPQRAASSYASAAELYELEGHQGADCTAARLLEQAAESSGDVGEPTWIAEFAGRARALYERHGLLRDAARARGAGARSYAIRGLLADARAETAAALAVLRENPDADTVRLMMRQAGNEVFAGSPEGEVLAAEALALAQLLDVDDVLMVDAFIARGLAYNYANRPLEAAAYYREAALIAAGCGAVGLRGLALGNLAGVLLAADPMGAREAATTALEQCRLAGARLRLSAALVNLILANLQLGDWDEVRQVIERSIREDGLGDDEDLKVFHAMFLALKGNAAAAAELLAAVPMRQGSEDPQDVAMLALTRSLIAAATGDTAARLREAQTALRIFGPMSMRHEAFYWAWPEAARAADELGDDDARRELLSMTQYRRRGEMAMILRAERELVLARRSAADGGPTAEQGLLDAIDSLRASGSPYHLAQGLLDLTEYLVAGGRDASDAVDEARGIAERLGAEPVLRRAENLSGRSASSTRLSGSQTQT
jgi:class 3 adenylate cyclase